MRTVSFQGIQLSQAERAKARFQASLRASIGPNPNLFDIPDAAPVQRDSRADREGRRYWEIVAEFKRYARTDFFAEGTPFVGDAFGF